MDVRPWLCNHSYLTFKGGIHGIKSIPLDKGIHVPTLHLDLHYLSGNELEILNQRQFKHIVGNFRKEIKEEGFADFVLEFPAFYININDQITKNLLTVYRQLRELFDKKEIRDWRDTEKKLNLEINAFKSWWV